MIRTEIFKPVQAAHWLVNATLEVLLEMRNRFAAARIRAGMICDAVYAKESASGADKVMHEQAYEMIAIAIGLGTLTAQILFCKFFNV